MSRLEDYLGPINVCKICEKGPRETCCEPFIEYYVDGSITLREFMGKQGIKIVDVPDGKDPVYDRF